ncbi:cytidine deaminase [Candidatus Campbellbacteria bacterium]|nr:MAG: cytidine deaminase [Candidatus Campbellbacteria bacterium]
MTNQEIIKKASELVSIKKLNGGAVSGEVGSVLVTESGNIYGGVSIDAPCGIGVCGEHTAIGNMLTGGETRIKKIVAVATEGILSPCGRCRELMYQVDKGNAETEVILSENKVMKLKDLLPEYWQK